MDKNLNCLGKHKILNNKIRYTFIFIFIFSVFSLTLQASITQICKESKVFKNQSQQSPITEEEEEKSHGDESIDDVVYLDNKDISNFKSEINSYFFNFLQLLFSSIPLDILVPPPKY